MNSVWQHTKSFVMTYWSAGRLLLVETYVRQATIETDSHGLLYCYYTLHFNYVSYILNGYHSLVRCIDAFILDDKIVYSIATTSSIPSLSNSDVISNLLTNASGLIGLCFTPWRPDMHFWMVETQNNILFLSCNNSGLLWFIVTKISLASEMVLSARWVQSMWQENRAGSVKMWAQGPSTTSSSTMATLQYSPLCSTCRSHSNKGLCLAVVCYYRLNAPYTCM